MQGAEVCDEGGSNTDDYKSSQTCNTSCDGYAPYCGDGITNGAEVCDDGDGNSDFYRFDEHCNGSCTANYSGGYCGDGIVQEAFNETCDDGNDATNDSCPSGPSGPCQNARCGDGFLFEAGGEQCEVGVNSEVACSEVANSPSSSSVAVCDEATCNLGLESCGFGPQGDGTVITEDGRMWTQCINGGTFDPDTNTCSGGTGMVQFCTTLDYACVGGDGGIKGGTLMGGPLYDACNDSTYAGYDDWRVPTSAELMRLVMCVDGPLRYPDRYNCGDSSNWITPAIDQSLFPNFPTREPEANVWGSENRTSSDLGFEGGYAWRVVFLDGGWVWAMPPVDAYASYLCVR